MLFSADDRVNHPVSLYAATEEANELMARNLPTIGLPSFTVYSPWDRPDMELVKHIKAIQEGKGIGVYNYGKVKRDFTYVDDIVEAIISLQDVIPAANIEWMVDTRSSATYSAPY